MNQNVENQTKPTFDALSVWTPSRFHSFQSIAHRSCSCSWIWINYSSKRIHFNSRKHWRWSKLDRIESNPIESKATKMQMQLTFWIPSNRVGVRRMQNCRNGFLSWEWMNENEWIYVQMRARHDIEMSGLNDGKPPTEPIVLDFVWWRWFGMIRKLQTPTRKSTKPNSICIERYHE
jgi:hypothetical protein